MPETIDGVVYPTTTGGRPFPTAASPGKALWQLIERAMRELDDAETDTNAAIAALTTLVNNAVTNADPSPQRRMLTSSGTYNTGASGFVRFPNWVADTSRGDPGNPSQASAGLTLSSSTLVVGKAGLYALHMECTSTTPLSAMAIRVNGVVRGSSGREQASGGSDSSVQHRISILARLAVNDVIDVQCGYSSGSTIFAMPTAGAANPDNLAGTPIFDAVRLGA